MKTLALMLLGLVTSAQSVVVQDKPVSTGEELKFKLSYGWFTVGRGTFKISDEYVDHEGKECLEINVHGKTAGLAGVFSKVDDRWGALIDKNSFLPYYSFRDLSEGDNDLKEKVYYNYDSMEVRVESSSVSDSEVKPVKHYDLEEANMFDLMGGLMYARSLDYSSLNQGDTVQLNAFFDNDFYDFEIVYHGVEKTKTKVGKVYCHKVVPVMEENSVFKGESAVKFWITADANRLPVKVIADMNFGKAKCELTSYKNVKTGIDFK